MKFSIGQQVINKDGIQAHTSYTVWKVVGYLENDVLVESYGGGYDEEIHPDNWEVKPGTRPWREHIRRYQESELFTLEEAFAEQRRLNGIKDKMNQEFDAVKDQIRKKLNQAAELVSSADALARPFGRTFYDLRDEGMELYQALDAGGWRHSHMQC